VIVVTVLRDLTLSELLVTIRVFGVGVGQQVSDAAIGVVGIKPAGVALIDRIVAHEPVEVDAASVPNRVAREEPPRPRVVVAVRQQGQAHVVVVVPILAAEPDGVVSIRTLPAIITERSCFRLWGK